MLRTRNIVLAKFHSSVFINDFRVALAPQMWIFRVNEVADTIEI